MWRLLLAITSILLLSACSAERYLGEDELLLSSVKMKSSRKEVRSGDYRRYVRQEANSRWFNVLKVPLGLYCLSGTDSTRRINRFFRRLGEAPVVYSETQTAATLTALRSALAAHGYLQAEVRCDTTCKGRRVKQVYHLQPGERTYIAHIRRTYDNDSVRREIEHDLPASRLKKGMPLDATLLSEERSRIIRSLQNRGYYGLHKEFLSYRADTLPNDYGAALTQRFVAPTGVDTARSYHPYRFRNVNVYEDIQPGEQTDSSYYHGINYFRNTKKFKLYRRVYNKNIAIRPDSLYAESALTNTYAALGALPSVSFSTVQLHTAADGTNTLDADIIVRHNKPHSISAELEGTNTAGDLGAAVALSYTHRNLLRAGESLSMKLRGAYEAITGLEGYSNQNYVEYSAEANLTFPTLLFPLPSRTRHKLKAASEISLMYNSQNRPEFHRRVVTGAWAYKWNRNGVRKWRHRIDLMSFNYIFMPWISDTFRKEYLESNDSRYGILRYSYENTFIMKAGYSCTYTSQPEAGTPGSYRSNGYQVRFSIETAGNLLNALSRTFSAGRDSLGRYRFAGVAYSQYAKFDLDYSKSISINEKNAVAFHAAFGLAIPYGNSTVIPYEKRYFSGGANSVRGWSVRELGPGKFQSHDGKIDFINQTGNLKLDLSVEYRTHLFWKLHGALFVDAGNIWNTRNYADQPGGQFHFDSFYKQIACSYGLGVRLNFDYFILRFDGGMKAVNPAYTDQRSHFPIIHPSFGRDFTFHFAVGLPF